MSSGQWEVVGRNKKEKVANQNGKKPSKTDKKTTVPVPKVEDILPLSQVKNIYSNVNKNNKENNKPQEKENKQKDAPKKQPAKKSEKQKQEVRKPKPKSIESALNLVTANDFKSSLEMSKQSFPDAPIVWLKELSTILNTKITPEVNDPIFTTKPDGYPMNIVPTAIKQVMEKALQDAGKPSAQLFYDISLTAMANDMSKGLPALGHKIWLQYLAFNNPQVTVAHLDKHNTLWTSYLNRQPIGLSILWALGQGGIKDFSVGFKVFKDFMLPLLDMKNYSRFVVKYLSQLLNRFANIGLSKENYLFLLELINSKRSLPNDVSQELTGLNKKLKTILLSKNSDKKYQPLFEPVLNRLTINASTAFKNDICDTLVKFLIADRTCFTTWEQLYAKYIEQSNILLKFIYNNWNKIPDQLDKKQFKELIKTFTVVNAQLSLKHKKDSDVQDASKLCKVLLEKMTVTKSFPWKFVIFVILLTIGSLLVYDFNIHGSWKKSQSVRTLKNVGVWEFGEKALDNANQGFNWTKQRIEEYAPGYIDAAKNILDVYMEVARDLGLILYNMADSFVCWAMEKVPVVLESIEKHVPGFIERLQEFWNTLASTIVDYWNIIYKYMTTEVFVGQLAPENMHKVFLQTVDTTQRYAKQYYNWIYEKVQTTIHGK